MSQSDWVEFRTRLQDMLTELSTRDDPDAVGRLLKWSLVAEYELGDHRALIRLQGAEGQA